MISIIIPVLNEAGSIGKLLDHLVCNSSEKNIAEIIVVDGGSSDDTINLVEKFASNSTYSIKKIHSDKGRAKQMNAGSEVASGTIFYFLHADSFPPKDFDKRIISEVQNRNPAGCFKMRFNSAHWWLRLASWFTKFSWRACRGGDQSQFITKDLFQEIGGYDENYVIYEDNILINELYARNKFVVIQDELLTSARLYHEKGVWNVQYHFLVIYLKKWMGADANELFSYYLKNVKGQQQTQQTQKTKAATSLADK